MAFPANLTFVTVTGTFKTLQGAGATPAALYFWPILDEKARGTPSFDYVGDPNHPQFVWIQDPTAVTPTILVPQLKSAGLDANGFFTTSLLCTDSPNMTPRGWRWQVMADYVMPAAPAGTASPKIPVTGYFRKLFTLTTPVAGGNFDISSKLPA